MVNEVIYTNIFIKDIILSFEATFIFRRLSLRTATNRLLMSLLVADFLLLLVCYLTIAQNVKGVPMFGTNGKKIGRSVITFVSTNSFNDIVWNTIVYIVYWRSNIAGCRASGFISTTAALAEVWSLAAVSLDRLLSIYYPLDKRKRITKSQVYFSKGYSIW